jgi:succinate dehydrogenase hydrophobic anchor subunit
MEARYRLGGVLCLLIAAAVAWLAIWRPLQDASAGAEIVRWMPRATVLVALCVVFGVYFMATGNRYPYRDVERQTLTPVGWVLIAVVAIAGLIGFFSMDAALRSMGYQ